MITESRSSRRDIAWILGSIDRLLGWWDILFGDDVIDRFLHDVEYKSYINDVNLLVNRFMKVWK